MIRVVRGRGLALAMLLSGCGDQGPDGKLTYAQLREGIWILSSPVALEGSTVVLTDNADPDLPLLSGTLVGQRLELETQDAEYDFNGDGTDEPAHVSAVFER